MSINLDLSDIQGASVRMYVRAGETMTIVYTAPGEDGAGTNTSVLGSSISRQTGWVTVQEIIDDTVLPTAYSVPPYWTCTQPGSRSNGAIDVKTPSAQGHVWLSSARFANAAEICTLEHTGLHNHGAMILSGGNTTSRRQSALGLSCKQPVTARVHVVGSGDSATSLPGVRLELTIDGSITGSVYSGVSETIDIELTSTLVISDEATGGILDESRIILVDIL